MTSSISPVCDCVLVSEVDTEWTGFWGAGLTNFMPFVLQGMSFFLIYNSSTGDIESYRISAPPVEPKPTALSITPALGAGWSALIPLTLQSQPWLLVYKSGSGSIRSGKISESLDRGITIALSNVEKTIAPAWDTFMPFTVADEPFVLAYSSTAGTLAIYKIMHDGEGLTLVLRYRADWATGWSGFLPFTDEGKPHFVAYRSADQRVQINSIMLDGDLLGITSFSESSGEAGDRLVLSFEDTATHTWYLLDYNSNPLFGNRLCKLTNTSIKTGATVLWNGLHNWTSFTPFVLDHTNNHFLAYRDDAEGTTSIFSVKPPVCGGDECPHDPRP